MMGGFTTITLCTPLEESEVKELQLGDVVYLNGEIYTARDKAHRRMLEQKTIPLKRGAVIYHCGPLVRRQRREEEMKWEVIAAGPTTSSRMDENTPVIIPKWGIRAIIGKGGMSSSTKEAMEKSGGVYFSFTGGAAVLAANCMKVIDVYWSDLGMAEAVWHLQVQNFGPLVVSIDARGNSLYEKVEEEARERVHRMFVRKRENLFSSQNNK
jgi:fumarate hydratase subunit beta